MAFLAALGPLKLVYADFRDCNAVGRMRRPRVVRWWVLIFCCTAMSAFHWMPAGFAEEVLGDSCRGDAPVLAGVRYRGNGWLDRSALAENTGLRIGERWSSRRRDDVRGAIEATRLFRSVAFRLQAEEGSCWLIVQLEKFPTIASIDVRGAEAPRLQVLRGLWRFVSGGGQGPSSLRERDVRRLLGIRAGTPFDPDALDRGSGRVLERYTKDGFVGAQIATHVRDVDANSVAVSVRVRAGKPLLVEQVSVVADSAVVQGIVLEALDEFMGKARTRHLLRNARRFVRRRLREQGYLQARVRIEWQHIDIARGGLAIEVDAGGRSTIEVVGNKALSTHQLLEVEDIYARAIITESTWRRIARAMRATYQEHGYYEAEVRVDTSTDGKIVFSVTEGAPIRVTEVRFIGNETVAAEQISEVVASGKRWFPAIGSRRLTDASLSQDVARIRELYVSQGYESAEVHVSVAVGGDRENGKGDRLDAEVVFEIEEGIRSVIGVVQGLGGVASLEIDPPPPPRGGDVFDAARVEAYREILEGLLRRRGYVSAHVEVEMGAGEGGRYNGDLEESEHGARFRSVDLNWRVIPGPRSRIADIVVRDNHDVREVVVRRDLRLREGEPVDSDALLDAQQRVYDTGVFRNVSIRATSFEREPNTEQVREDVEELDDASDAPVDSEIVVSVSARPPGRIGYGVGYDTRQGLTAFGEITHANINHRAQRLSVRAQMGLDPDQSAEPTQYVVTASFVEPRVLDGPWEAHVSAVAERNTRTIDQFDIERYSAFTGVGRDLGDHLRFVIDAQIERAHVFNVLPLSFRERDERDASTVSLSSHLIFDGRDSAFDPRSGFFESLRLRYAIPGLSTTDLIEVDAQHTHLIPLWWNWGLVYSLRAGWVRSLDGNPIVPIRQRYFLGGGESVRGFAVNSLGPYDGNGNEIGGDLALVAKTEVRVPLFWGVGLVLFLDGGGNYLIRRGGACCGEEGSLTAIRDGSFSVDNFRRAAGVGLRYVTPVGPISVDYGVKLDRRRRRLSDGSDPQESFGEFSVSVGARF